MDYPFSKYYLFKDCVDIEIFSDICHVFVGDSLIEMAEYLPNSNFISHDLLKESQYHIE